MGRVLGIAGVQMAPVPWDPAATERKMNEYIRMVTATFPSIDLILFPELAVNAVAPWAMEGTPTLPGTLAEPVPGPTTERLAEFAQRYHCWLVPGSMYERAGDQIYNTTPVFSPQGEMVTRYRKLFPWRPWETTTPGDRLGLFDIPQIGRIGICICYDLWFPEVCRGLALSGAEVILHPSLTSTVDRPAEQVLARANAIFNQAYFIDVNMLVPANGGMSIFVDPNGRDLQVAGEHECVLTEWLDLDLVTSVRRNGTLGLNALLKQWRDQQGLARVIGTQVDTAWLQELGPLTLRRE